MANIKDGLENNVQTTYYLFRPDTIVKTYGNLTFIFNPILKGWISTSHNIEDYFKTGAEFKILDESTLKELIETMTDNIILKKEFTARDIEDLIFGRAKIEVSMTNHQDIAPEVFKDIKNLEGVNIKGLSSNQSHNPLIACMIIILIINLFLVGLLFFQNRTWHNNVVSCEPALRTVTYHTGDKLKSDFSYYSSCSLDDFKTISFKDVDTNNPGIYLYTGIDKNGQEKTGTIIVE